MPTMKEMLGAVVGVPIVINDVNYPNQYADDLAIDRTDLEGEFIQHSERYAYYATLAELADDRYTRLKEDLETLAAGIDAEKRSKYDAIRTQDPKFKMTEAMFEHEVKLDPRYQAAQKKMQDARHLAKTLKCAPMAFAHRRDMLIELAKVHMSGMSDPRIQRGSIQQVKQIIQGNRQAAAATAPGLPPAPVVVDELEHAASPTGTTCSVCHSPQFQATGGVSCENGHGGAPSLEESAPASNTSAPASRRRAPRTNQ